MPDAMEEVAFSSPEAQARLRGPATAVIATINPNGSPLATPMWYVHDEEGFGMVSVDGLQKVRNLRRDPRISVAVEAEPAQGAGCIMVQGTVEFLDSSEDRRSLGALFAAKYGEGIEKRWGGPVVPDDRVLFRIHPTRVKLYG